MDYRIWDRSYRTETIKKIESEVRSRTQAMPGFPYISSRGAKMVHMTYGLKLLTRANTMAALYAKDDRNIKVQIDMANNTLRDIAHKDYLHVLTNEHGIGNMYTLGEVGFDYLGAERFSTDFRRTELYTLYSINRVFNDLCADYREQYTIEWVTDPEFMGIEGIVAASIFWVEYGDRAENGQLWLALNAHFEMQQVKEVLEKQKKWVEKYEDVKKFFPVEPEIWVVSSRPENFKLKIVEDGKECVSEEEIGRWALGK